MEGGREGGREGGSFNTEDTDTSTSWITKFL